MIGEIGPLAALLQNTRRLQWKGTKTNQYVCVCINVWLCFLTVSLINNRLSFRFNSSEPTSISDGDDVEIWVLLLLLRQYNTITMK